MHFGALIAGLRFEPAGGTEPARLSHTDGALSALFGHLLAPAASDEEVLSDVSAALVFFSQASRTLGSSQAVLAVCEVLPRSVMLFTFGIGAAKKVVLVCDGSEQLRQSMPALDSDTAANAPAVLVVDAGLLHRRGAAPGWLAETRVMVVEAGRDDDPLQHGRQRMATWGLDPKRLEWTVVTSRERLPAWFGEPLAALKLFHAELFIYLRAAHHMGAPDLGEPQTSWPDPDYAPLEDLTLINPVPLIDRADAVLADYPAEVYTTTARNVQNRNLLLQRPDGSERNQRMWSQAGGEFTEAAPRCAVLQLDDVLYSPHEGVFLFKGCAFRDPHDWRARLVPPQDALPPELVRSIAGRPIGRSVSGRTLMLQTTGFAYTDWLVEVLPRLAMSAKLKLEPDWVFSTNPDGFAIEAAELAGMPTGRQLKAHNADLIRFDRLLLPLLGSSVVEELGLHSAVIGAVDTFARALRQGGPGPEKIYVSRSDERRYRSLLNEQDVEARLSAQGFEIVTTSSLNLVSKINLFKNARVVVGPVGPGLMHAMFSTRLERLIILSPNTFSPAEYALRPFRLSGSRIDQVIGLGIDALNTRIPEHGYVHSDWLIDPEQVADVLAQA